MKRTVSLLLSLADLADRAAHQSAPIRQLMLWVLYLAESVARKFTLDICGPVALPEVRVAFSEDIVADALRLAACLRLLAALLASMTDEDVWESRMRPDTVRALACFATFALCSGAIAFKPPLYPDTS